MTRTTHRATTLTPPAPSPETLQALLEGLESLPGVVELVAERTVAALVHPALMDEHVRVRAERRMRRRVPGYPNQYLQQFAGGDPAFALWLAIIDDRLTRNLATTHHALGGAGWREAYDHGTNPQTYADDLTLAALTHND